MKILHIIIIAIVSAPWMYLLIHYAKRYMKRKRRIKEFDKTCENVLGILDPYTTIANQIKDVLQMAKFQKYKLYQNRLRQNTRYE